MGIILFLAFTQFLVAKSLMGQLATLPGVIPENTVTGKSAVTKDDPTSSTRLNTNTVTGTSAVSGEDPKSSTRLNTNTVTGTSAVSGEDPTSSTRLNTTELDPVTLMDEPTLESFPEYRASVQLKQIYLPFVIAAGTFGNVVVVVIQSRLPPNQKSSMSVYFTALAISDTTALWTGWFWLLESFGVTLSAEYQVQRDYSSVFMDGLCRIRVWVTYAFGQISAWILVSMTIHRTLSIVWPHKMKNHLSERNAKKTVVLIVSFCTLSNAHILYGHSLVAKDKGQKAFCFFTYVGERYGEFFNRVWVWEDMVVAVFLPFACLLVTNTVLIRKVGQSLRETRDSLAEGRSDPFASRDKKLSSMTITLIAMSVAFLLLTSPVSLYMILERTLAYDTEHNIRLRAESELAVSTGVVLWFTNVAINFYLYCLTGARYRAAFVTLFGCGRSVPDRTLANVVIKRDIASVNTVITLS